MAAVLFFIGMFIVFWVNGVSFNPKKRFLIYLAVALFLSWLLVLFFLPFVDLGFFGLAVNLYSVFVILGFSFLRSSHLAGKYLLLGYYVVVLIALCLVLKFQGVVDSSGNILALFVVISFVVSFIFSPVLGFCSLIFCFFVSLSTVARMGTALSLVSIVVLLVYPLVSKEKLLLTDNFSLYPGAVSRLVLPSLLLVLYLMSLVIAVFFRDNMGLNSLLTYRPILWGSAVQGLSSTSVYGYLIPANFLDDISYQSGRLVYSYYNWEGDIKSYSSHSFVMENINRWGVFGTAAIFLSCLWPVYRFSSLWARFSIFLILVNGLGATVLVGTGNMFGVLLLLLMWIGAASDESTPERSVCAAS